MIPYECDLKDVAIIFLKNFIKRRNRDGREKGSFNVFCK